MPIQTSYSAVRVPAATEDLPDTSHDGSTSIHVGIDASNIRTGGGLTHLVELLRVAEPRKHGFSRITVWAERATQSRIEDRPWLVRREAPGLEKSLPYRTYWRASVLSDLARKEACDLLFVPGGSYVGDFHPSVTMSRNLLPYELREAFRYGFAWLSLKYTLLRFSQSAGLRRADGVIFLNEYARRAVTRITGPLAGESVTVPHGIDQRFLRAPRPQRSAAEYSLENPFRLLYVSIVDVYKHQWNVAEAVVRLRASGVPVVLDLVGPAYPASLKRLQRVLGRVDPSGAAVRWLGAVPHDELHHLYDNADACVFASSCENMPNILLEGMASGLPVACSDRGPMPEVLDGAGVHFDPENIDSIARAIEQLFSSPRLRAEKARAAFDRMNEYSWHRCADDTFAFLSRIAKSSKPAGAT